MIRNCGSNDIHYKYNHIGYTNRFLSGLSLIPEARIFTFNRRNTQCKFYYPNSLEMLYHLTKWHGGDFAEVVFCAKVVFPSQHGWVALHQKETREK